MVRKYNIIPHFATIKHSKNYKIFNIFIFYFIIYEIAMIPTAKSE